MKVTPIKTPIINPHDDLVAVITAALPVVSEKSIIVITSKVVALAEGRVVPLRENADDKHTLVRQEAEYYIGPTSSYNLMLTVKSGLIAVNAGIDESNVNNAYVLYPQDSYASAASLWQALHDHYRVKELGVLITDSTSIPLKWGTVGRSLAHCGFAAIKDMIGQPDIFGRPMKMTKMNIAEGLAAAAVLEMGEAAEQTPLCLIEAATHVAFASTPPSAAEIADLKIAMAEDVYTPILLAADWQPGGSK